MILEQGPPFRAVVFDLDGTLTDPSPGIPRCIAHAFAGLGLPAPPEAELRGWIGPSLRASFATALGTDDAAEVERAIVLYRERYERVGILENAPYPGIAELLLALRSSGTRLFVATSKPLPYARRILRHFELDHHFEDVAGVSLERNVEKEELLRTLVQRLSAAERLRAAMVGDRSFDVKGALAHGLLAVGVTYGYGSEEELRAAGADRIVHTVAGLHALVVPGDAPPP